MREYDITNIEGVHEEFSVEITSEMLGKFREITGDENPLHCDARFAKKKGYKVAVAYGLLTNSFLSTLCGMYLPGKRSLIQEMRIKFPFPVYVGDSLVVSGTVQEVHVGTRQIVLKVQIVNQDGKKVLRGTMRVGLLDG